MVIGIIGENCSGKSTLAGHIKEALGAQIITGKDWLRMAKSPSEAEAQFKRMLAQAVDGENVIYVIAQRDQLALLPAGAVRILVTADLDTIKERFKARMHSNLPAPVAAMLERNHGMFDDCDYDEHYDGVNGDPSTLCAALQERLSKG